MEKKLQKIYLTYYNLLVVQDLWQIYYQILCKSKVTFDIMIKNVKHVELNISIATVF